MRFFTIIFLLTLSIIANSQEISQVRAVFHSAVLNPEESKKFHEFIQNIEEPSPIIKAYQAVSEAMLAQMIWNPFSKLSRVMKYDKLMEVAVEEDPMNIEIRFLRLAIEHNLPPLLGMSTHLQEDVSKIVANLSNVSTMQVDPMFGKYIFYFLKETNLCSSEQLAIMKQNFESAVSTTGAD